jgi:ferredoxin
MISVNQELCIGCGACTAECPNTFDLNEEGKSIVTSQEDVECAKRAVDVCPVQAISVD